MVKVSISLPNNTQITFESDEAEVLREIVSMALRDLPRDLMQASAPGNESTANESAEKSTSVAGSALSAAAPPPEPKPEPDIAPAIEAPAAEPAPEPAPAAALITAPVAVQEPSGPPGPSGEPSGDSGPSSGNNGGNSSGEAAAEIPAEFLSEQGRADFMAFCQETNPMGDMRRVVVAAEGANRHFGADGVNAEDLGWLFDMAGWRRPGNFTQTLRNAARSKFGWMERIPGRSGRYAATPLGLSKTLGS